ncbi:MAG: DHHA1 domain-containing protein [Candidatus Zixiibacteriota bacterium]
MTERLYYNNSFLLEFESVVTGVQRSDIGFEITLKESAFYPDSGGQLHDAGLLDGEKVISVIENDKGEVIHITEGWKAEVSARVVGTIDKERRLENMRKHTGQHILSRAFIHAGGADTVSAHLGEVESTIELSAAEIDEATLKKVENLANQIVLENHPVKIGYYELDELKSMPIRKIPELEGKYRIIQVGEFDYTACGGTHCRSSAEVGLIKIIATEKLRGHLRVTFLVGLQALDDYAAKHSIISDLAGRFTCHFTDLPASVAKLSDQNAALRKDIAGLNKKLIPIEIERLKGKGDEVRGIRIVIQSYDDQDPKDLKDLAMQVTRAYDSVAILSSNDKLLISVSEGLPTNAARVAKLFMEKFPGKGGGSPAFAQIGNIPPERREEFLRALVNIIKEEISGD